MVTLAFSVVLLATALLHALIDMFLYKTSFAEAAFGLYQLDFGLGRALLLAQIVLAFAASLLIDWRKHKKKQQQDGGQPEQDAHEKSA